MTREQILEIIAGLKSDCLEESDPALAAAQQLLGGEQAFGSAQVTLLLEVQKEIHPINGSPHPALNQVYQFLLDKVFDKLEDTIKIPEVAAWYDEQMNYDGIVLAKAGGIMAEHYWAETSQIAAALHSNDPETVQQGLVEAEDFFDRPTYIGWPSSLLLLALKDILDRKSVLGDTLADQARKLLREELRLNWNFLNFDNVEMKKLADWYHQQDDTAP